MKPVGRIETQPWMTAPATRAVIAALAAGGVEARFVGGCVRDAILGRPVTDVDLATPAPPERVTALLAAAGITVVPTGLKHGTVMAVADGTPFEITTLRRDVETYGRHARVVFTDDWLADAARRDLSINALFCAPDGTLYDPFGGRDDLKRGRIRFVGDARERIREDVLRLLRFFRFYAWYGAPPPDPEALAAARELAPLLPTLSGERVRTETLKLLLAPEPATVVELMREVGVLAHFLPEAGDTARLRALVTLEGATPRRIVPGGDAIRRLAALTAGEAAAAKVAERLRLSNAERAQLMDLAVAAATGFGIDREMSAAERRRLLYRIGPARYRDRALLAWATAVAAGAPVDRRASEAWIELIALAVDWTRPVFPLKGRDAVAAGLAPGRRVGDLMQALEEWWVAGDFQADRAACLAKLKELAAAG